MNGLMPREHGAYAQLGFPLATGLVYARGDGGAVAFAVAAVALFLAHEPVAVLAGTRGPRLRDQLGPAARRRVAALAAAAILGGVAAIGLAPPRAWMAALLPGGLALLLLPLLGTRRIKSVPAELLVAAVFTSTVAPLALAGPATWRDAGVAAAVWLGAVWPAVLAVHAVKFRHKGRGPGGWTVVGAPVAAATVLAAGLALALTLPPWALDFLAVLPPAAAVLAISLAPPHPRHLKRVGWTMVGADAVALGLLLAL